MPFERGIHAVKDTPLWDGMAVLEAQGRIDLKHRLSRKSRAALIAIIMEQQEAIADTYGALLDAEMTLLWAKDLPLPQRTKKGRRIYSDDTLDARLVSIRTAIARCQKSMEETDG